MAISQGAFCRVFAAPFDVRMPAVQGTKDGDIETLVQPDIKRYPGRVKNRRLGLSGCLGYHCGDDILESRVLQGFRVLLGEIWVGSIDESEKLKGESKIRQVYQVVKSIIVYSKSMMLPRIRDL